MVDVELVIKIIDLVSYSKNKNSVVKPEWHLIVRLCDRLEAMGEIGIVRCWQYTKHKKRPLYLPSTPRVTNLYDLQKVVENRDEYDQSDSMIDHFYDKILLLNVESNNPYIKNEANVRHKIAQDFVLDFGHFGNIDPWMATQK